jgi:tRNA A-37 threonylcarbamoyl transferase component Bud32/tetratricopeptide (TPR) repeat protein
VADPAGEQPAPAERPALRRRPEGAGPPAEPPIPDFGKYSHLREIGHGGKGVVYEGLDTVLDRKVALKMTRRGASADPEEIKLEEERFLIEARLSAHLPKHPHIVSVYEAGVTDGRRYLAMELVRGQPMTAWRKSGSVTFPQQVKLLRDVALAIEHAHKHGIIHRDLKPQNILVDAENQPHVTDFGLAKLVGQDIDIARTVPGKVWGTPAYMSPEHARGSGTVDHRSDVYSLGVMLYEVLTGQPPFRGSTNAEVLEKVTHDPVPKTSRFAKGAQGPTFKVLEAISLKALSKDPAGRHPSAKAFADDLSRWLNEGRGGAKGLSPKVAGVAAAALVALGLVLYGVLGGSSVEETLASARGHWEAGDYQQALSAYEQALREDSENGSALEGKKAAQAKIQERIDLEKQQAADAARRDAEAKAREAGERRTEQEEARRRASDEQAALLKVEQLKLEEERRKAEERAKAAEEAAKKAEEALRKQPPTPAPTPAPAPAPAPAPVARPAAAPTGLPLALVDGTLHWEAEDFTGGDRPAPGQDYNDTTRGNSGKGYRNQDVDIAGGGDSGFYVMDTASGEWLRYRFQGAGRYGVELRYASAAPAAVRFEVDGADATGPIGLPQTGAPGSWALATARTVPLSQGVHVLRLLVDSGAPHLDSFRLKPLGLSPPPEQARQREAERTIREVFKADYAKKTPADLLALAGRLHGEGRKTLDDDAAAYVLFSEARDLAAAAGDAGLALAAIEEIAKTTVVDAWEMRKTALATAAKAQKAPAAIDGIARIYSIVIDAALALDEFEAAGELVPGLEATAKVSLNTGLLRRAQGLPKEIAALKREYDSVNDARKVLKAKPEDPEAASEMGKYRCFVKADWDGGLPLLARGSDEALRAPAVKDLARPADPGTQLEACDGWLDLAEKERNAVRRGNLLARAWRWYVEAFPKSSALARAKVEKRIEEVHRIVESQQGLDLLKLVDAQKDAVRGTWRFTGGGLESAFDPAPAVLVRLQVPFVPPPEYDLKVVAERKAGSRALVVGLAEGNRQFMVTLDSYDGATSGLERIDERGANGNETRFTGRVFTDKKRSTILCSVRRDSVVVTVDGKVVVCWKANYGRLTLPAEAAVPFRNTLFLGSWQASFHIARLVLTPVSGQGLRLR